MQHCNECEKWTKILGGNSGKCEFHERITLKNDKCNFKPPSKIIEPGIKYDDGKLEWSLLPFEELQDVLRILQMGAKKYAPDNWKHVQPYKTRYFNAAMRHIIAWKCGEETDSESGKSHIAHAICCLLFVLWHDKQKVGD